MARVKTRFVPVTLNADRLPDGPAGDFFRALLKRWPQGLWVVTPEGKTLGFHYHQPTPGDTFKENAARWVRDTCAMLDHAAEQAGPLPRREAAATNPFPDRGVGLTKSGGARLALSATATRAGRPEGSPVFDSFVLPKDDWAAFAPADRQSWALPDSAARAFAPALSPLTDSIFVPRPKDMTDATVTATRDGGIVRYRVSLKSRHLRDGQAGQEIRAELRGEGVGELDAAGRLARVLFVLKGTYVKGPGAKPTATAAVVEWRAD